MRRSYFYVTLVLIALVIVVFDMIMIRSSQKQAARFKEQNAEEPKSEGASRSWAAGMDQKELEDEIVKWMGGIQYDCRNLYRVQEKLSLLFQEWGSRDIDAALRFLDREHIGYLRSDDSIVRPRDALSYSAIIGHAAKNPADAWQRLLNLLDQRKEMLIQNGAFLRPWIDELAAESVFRTWYKVEPQKALQSLRNYDSWFDITHDQLMQGVTSRTIESRLLLGSALRVVMSETKDTVLREKIYQEFVIEDSDMDGQTVGVILSGVFEQDPKQAWNWVGADGIDWNDQLVNPAISRILRAIMMWSNRDPAAAKDFLIRLGPGDYQPLLFEAYMFGQIQKRPELIVDLLDSPAFLNTKKLLVHPEFIVEQDFNTNLSWPVDYDGEMQPDFVARLQRFEKAFEESSFSDESKQAVKKASENAQIEYLKKKECMHESLER